MNTANITISFVSSYTGSYRVCWRVQGSGDDYICIVTYCSEGEQCEFSFPIETLNDQCDSIVIEGYIQPLCEDIESEDNRIPWEVDLYSTNLCKKFEVNCIQGSISSVTVVDSGTAVYDPLDPPLILVDDPGGQGSGAVLTAVINGSGILTGVTVNNSGTLYDENTTVTVASGSGILPVLSPVIICNSSQELPDCGDNTQVIPSITLGTPYMVCTLINMSEDYLNVDSDILEVERQKFSCTCNCIEYSVSNTSPFLTLPFRYYDCDGIYIIFNIPPSTEYNICIGTYGTYLLSNFIQVTPIGPCS